MISGDKDRRRCGDVGRFTRARPAVAVARRAINVPRHAVGTDAVQVWRMVPFMAVLVHAAPCGPIQVARFGLSAGCVVETLIADLPLIVVLKGVPARTMRRDRK